MNQNILLKYMEQRYKKKIQNEEQHEPGPVVTISRETGCPAKKIAALIIEKINAELIPQNKKPWRAVSKEILYDSAKELNMNPDQIKYVFEYEEKSSWDDIFSSLSSKYYKSDKRIRKTIADVIHSIGEQGNVIIIGRGSVAITKDIAKSLHINLEAPLEWRAIMLSQKHGMTLEEAQKYAIETDKKRVKFRNSFYGRNTDYTRFDITFNCMTLSMDEISDTIIELLKRRNFI